MSKAEKIKNFNPNDIGNKDNTIFGLPFTVSEAEVVILPMPWEVTVSYSAGTARGPEAVYDASFQIDLYEPYIKDAWKLGIAMDEISAKWLSTSDRLRKKAEKYIGLLEEGKTWEKNKTMQTIRLEINKEGKAFKEWVKKKTLLHLKQGKLVCGLGGDHSTPLGIVEALAEQHKSFGILHLDAHADLRNAYEGFEYSHASIMYNVLKVKQVEKLVQVGIRDYCEEEVNVINTSKGRVKTYFDRDIKHRQFEGETIKKIYSSIIKDLPKKVYISFDIDALDPKLCPNTGTPVAGGFEFEEALYIIQLLVESGRTIIGCDLNEVGPGNSDWDANVGGRILYRMCNLMALSNGRIKR